MGTVLSLAKFEEAITISMEACVSQWESGDGDCDDGSRVSDVIRGGNVIRRQVRDTRTPGLSQHTLYIIQGDMSQTGWENIMHYALNPQKALKKVITRNRWVEGWALFNVMFLSPSLYYPVFTRPHRSPVTLK